MAGSIFERRSTNMLSALDETFLHQVALPFELCGPSDHRFFDRTVVTAAAPDGSAAVIMGMGVYKNMNVMDGFAAAQTGHARQLNLRLSRELRPDLRPVLGPLRMEVIKPFEEIRFILDDNAAGFSFDLTATKFLVPVLEEPHENRSLGRVTQDYLRFNQLMAMNGTLRIEGSEIDAKNWLVFRDHSWGVRPGVGGFEPPVPGVTDAFPSAARTGGKGMMLFYVGFNVENELGGSLQVIENGIGERVYSTGHFGPADGAQSRLKDYDWSVETFAGTRAPKRIRIHAVTEDGSVYDIEAEPTSRPWAYKGFGYDAGYHDGKGQGVWRAKELLTEHDVFDISDVEEVVMPGDRRVRPNHREVAVRVTVNGRPGHGYMPFIAIGDIAKLKAA
jgi:hypothetical protein